MGRRTEWVGTGLVLGLAAAGCGVGSSSSSAGGSEPTTPAALAYVAAEHVGDPASASASDDFEELGSRSVGASLRYGSDGEYDGDLLAVGVGGRSGLADCAAPENASLSGCVTTDRGVLMWEDETPEEDPGVVYAVVEKTGSTAVVVYAGPPVVAGSDPRELDLPIEVDTLFDIANDPRVDLTTSAEANEGGADASYWR